MMLLGPAVPLLLLCAAAIWYQWRSNVEFVHDALMDSANVIAFALDRDAERSKAILETLAASQLIDARDWRAFHKLASAAVSREQGFIALTEPSGAQPVRTMIPYGDSPPVNPIALGAAAADIEWNGRRLPLSSQGLAKRVFETGKIANSGVYYGVSVKKPVVSIGVPVVRDGKVVYVLILGYPADHLVSLVASAAQPQARVTIIDSDGRIVARNINPGEGIGVRVNDQTLAVIRENEKGTREGRNLNGEETVGAFRRMQLTDWTVYASIPKTIAYARARDAVTIWVTISLLVFGAGLVATRRLWGEVAPPLVALGHSAQAIQRGEALRLPRTRIVEINELTRLLTEAASWEKREREEIVKRVAAEESERATRDLMGQLVLSESRFRTLFEQSGVGIASVDLDTNRFVLVNRRMCEITGYTAEELLQRTFFDITHPADLDKDSRAMMALAAGCEAYETEKRYIRKDGSMRWVELHVRRFPAAGEGSNVSFAAVIDVTSRKQAEFALKQADQRKDEFLATLAHELRNPLAPIRNGLEIIRQRADDTAQVTEVRAMMERQVKHIVRLVDDLLDVSRISTGRIQLRKAAVDVREIARSAMEGWRPALARDGHDGVLTLDSHALMVDGDAARLRQIVDNLLDNAIKYSDRPGRVELSAARRGGRVVICVTDSGIGIPRDQLRSIFELFSQVRDGAQAGGLGIGLHLVRKLVELHGGSVRVESEGAGAGSRFTVELPLMQSQKAPAAAAPRAIPAAGRLGILIVDDNADAANSLAMLVEAFGHDVTTAFSGEEALAKAAACPPSVVLLDLGMPGMDGYAVARKMREMPSLAEVCIVAVSGWGQAEDRERTAQAGFSEHLVKPVDPAELEHLIASLSHERV